MNEIEGIRFKLSKAKNIDDIVEACKLWRDILVTKIRVYRSKKLRSYQIPLSDKIIEFRVTEGSRGNEIISLWARQSGKTETMAITVLALGTFYIIFMNEDFNAGLFAPVKSMITHVTRNRLRKRFAEVRTWLADKAGIKQIAGEGLSSSLFVLKSLITDKEFFAQSLSVGEQAEIIGGTFSLMVIEQSELVNSMKLKNDVFPMGATKGGVRVLTGTTSPYFKNEYYRAAVIKWNDDPEKNKSTADFVELVDYIQASKVSTAYRRYVSKEKKRMGEDSIEFRTQYGLEWAQTALKFIGWEDLAGLEAEYIWSQECLRFFGIDVARAGDSTVVTIIEIDGTGIHIIAWLELEGIDFETQIPKIVPFLKQFAPLRYGLVDRKGMGVAIFDMLKKRLWNEERDEYDQFVKRVAWARVGAFEAGTKTNHEMFQAMDREFQHDRVHFPKHTRYKREKNRFIDQLLDLERQYTGHTLKLSAPNIRDRHDDFPISLALAIYAFKQKSFHAGVTSVKI